MAAVAGLPPLDLMEGFWDPKERPYSIAIPRSAARDNPVWWDYLPIRWEALKPDPLHILLSHSDCDGEIAAEDCGPIADSLERLTPRLPVGDAIGHIGNWRDKTAQFVTGLRKAAAAGENVGFY